MSVFNDNRDVADYVHDAEAEITRLRTQLAEALAEIRRLCPHHWLLKPGSADGGEK